MDRRKILGFHKKVSWLRKTLPTKSQRWFSTFQDLFVNDIFHFVETEGKGFYFLDICFLFSGHGHSYFLEIAILVLLVPSDAGGGGGGGDGDGGGDGFPTTLPAWQGPRGYHAQGSNIPFGESLTPISNLDFSDLFSDFLLKCYMLLHKWTP